MGYSKRSLQFKNIYTNNENLEMVEEEETIVSRRKEVEGKVETTIMIMITMVEEEDKEEMEEEVRVEKVMEKDFKEVIEEDFKEVTEKDLKEEMEEDFKEEMVVEEMVEDKEAMDPKIANILNVTKTILREALEEV